MPEPMDPYDERAWTELARWREHALQRESKHLIPGKMRERIRDSSQSMQQRFEDLPGATRFQETFLDALKGLTTTVNRVGVASARKAAVSRAYRRHGHELEELVDVRKLGLRDVDKVKPRLNLRYILATAAEGAAAGFAVSGGELLMTVGSAASAGAAAAPGAGTIAGVMAADAAIVLAAMARAVAQTAAFYGYDVELPEEQMFALGVLNVGVASPAGKLAAYAELNKLVQALARRATWEILDKNVVTRLVSVVYTRLGMNLTKEKLGQAVPVVGVVIGAGLNAQILARVTSSADLLYRQRFLCEKYGIEMPEVSGTSGADELGTGVIPIETILNEQIEDEDEPPELRSTTD